MYQFHPHSEYWLYTDDEIKKLPTRQLLKHYISTHSWYHGEEDWDSVARQRWQLHREYVTKLKAELDTREHIPNKKESKAIRKARIKRGV